MSEWTKCSDRMPEGETPVLAWWDGEVRILEIRWEHPTYEEPHPAFQYWDDPTDDGQEIDWEAVTHWMPLPESPNDSTGDSNDR